MSHQGYGQPPYGGQQGQYYPPPQQAPHGQGQYPPPGQYPPQGQYQQPPPPPQGGYYGQPPQGQYPPPGGAPQYGNSPQPGQHGGYPPQGHHQPSPPQQYGQYPPQGQYQQPPPQQPYGAPPPGQYGAPPPSGSPYGHPPPHQPPQQSYGAPSYPPPGAQFPPTPASPGYGSPQIINWDPTEAAKACRTAMKGFGTDEKLLIRTLADKDPHQIEALKTSFQRQFNRDLVNDIKKETSGDLEYGLMSVARGPLLADVHNLRDALAGPGTNEKLLNDILLSRSNSDMQAIKSTYYRIFSRSLENDVRSDLSMKTERHFMIVLGATRAEDAAPVVPQQVEQEVLEIYKATEGRMGTDELLLCSILSTRNDNQIRAIAQAYQQRYSKSLESVIKSEFSGHMEDALLYQLRHAVDKYMHAATLIEESMAGMGTREKLLARRVVQAHWDRTTLNNVRAAYSQRFGKDLARRIKGETSGDFERFLLACIGEPI
ncbi:related to annexin XIV [Cephalotrichum gorgonifer]|uniref:Annexin n=1 Tax=Cephalotrichum gorgonifer TaxID=2041049 RepID=A0AAE8N0R9_9PEZI|nr:related to annexin XIV [Cephalotrichum gorgonifer]